MAEVGEPTQYGYAERLMRTIKEEEVSPERLALLSVFPPYGYEHSLFVRLLE